MNDLAKEARKTAEWLRSLLSGRVSRVSVDFDMRHVKLLESLADEVERLREELSIEQETVSATAGCAKHWKRERDRLRAAREWRPIDTAPKDGGEILMSSPRIAIDDMWTGRWAKGNGWVTGGPQAESIITPRIAPTHWLPLPAPPEEKDE